MSVKLLDFHAEWCGPCTKQEPVVNEVDKDYEGLEVDKIDVDEEHEKAQSYGVRAVPTIIVEVDGEPQEKLVGFQSREELDEALSKYF